MKPDYDTRMKRLKRKAVAEAFEAEKYRNPPETLIGQLELALNDYMVETGRTPIEETERMRRVAEERKRREEFLDRSRDSKHN